jgi:hypothetical protein
MILPPNDLKIFQNIGQLDLNLNSASICYLVWGVQASALTIAEMKDKLRTLNTEVEQLQGEVLYKVKVLNKMHVDYALSVKARTALRDEITKCASVVKDKKV